MITRIKKLKKDIEDIKRGDVQVFILLENTDENPDKGEWLIECREGRSQVFSLDGAVISDEMRTAWYPFKQATIDSIIGQCQEHNTPAPLFLCVYS